MAKELHLPNWNLAASPCLRSRLAFGVEATSYHLSRIEAAEDIVKKYIRLEPHQNMRVRQLVREKGVVEVDADVIHNKDGSNIWDLVKSELMKLGKYNRRCRWFNGI